MLPSTVFLFYCDHLLVDGVTLYRETIGETKKLLKELKARFVVDHIKTDLKERIEADGWRAGEIDRMAIYEEYKPEPLAGLIDIYDQLIGVQDATMPTKERDIRIETCRYFMAGCLDVWDDDSLKWLVDSVGELVGEVRRLEGEIKELRNNAKKHNHSFLGAYTGRAVWA